MSQFSNLTPRRGFLGTVAAGAAALGLGSLAGPLNVAKALGGVSAADSASAEEWLKKITGKHRQVFDTPAVNGGLPLAWARVYLSTNNGTGTADADLTAVVILRHEGIPYAFSDAVWSKYKFGEMFKVEDKLTKAPAVRNTFAHVKPDELFFPDMSVDELQKRGVLFGVCDMAITVYSTMTANNTKGDAAVIKKEWLDGVLPGIQVVPSGVWAVNRAQEHGCTYCFAG